MSLRKFKIFAPLLHCAFSLTKLWPSVVVSSNPMPNAIQHQQIFSGKLQNAILKIFYSNQVCFAKKKQTPLRFFASFSSRGHKFTTSIKIKSPYSLVGRWSSLKVIDCLIHIWANVNLFVCLFAADDRFQQKCTEAERSYQPRDNKFASSSINWKEIEIDKKSLYEPKNPLKAVRLNTDEKSIDFEKQKLNKPSSIR